MNKISLSPDQVFYNEFIGIYKNVFPIDFCKHVIEEFDRNEKSGISMKRQEYENIAVHFKDDTHLDFNIFRHLIKPFNNTVTSDLFFSGLQTSLNHYVEKFSILKEHPLSSYSMKVQKTYPGQGYHMWHCERHKLHEANSRVLTYILYLNTIENINAGETEFLYQKTRIQPEENKLLIWPADFTHVHRGNVVFGNQPKYIITGWFHYS